MMIKIVILATFTGIIIILKPIKTLSLLLGTIIIVPSAKFELKWIMDKLNKFFILLIIIIVIMVVFEK